MTDNAKFMTGLIIGAAAGAALTLLLAGDKGKEIWNDVKENAEDLYSDLADKLHEFDGMVDDLIQKGKSFLQRLEQKTNDTAHV